MSLPAVGTIEVELVEARSVLLDIWSLRQSLLHNAVWQRFLFFFVAVVHVVIRVDCHLEFLMLIVLMLAVLAASAFACRSARHSKAEALAVAFDAS